MTKRTSPRQNTRHAMRRRKAVGPTAKPAALTTSSGFAAFVVDGLSELGDVTAKSMFGGVGLYCDGVFFGIIARDVVYFKTDEVNRPAYRQRRMPPFMPNGKKNGRQPRYYAVPLDVLESPTLVDWARAAVLAAMRLRT
jgi:DNA transformation protein and related proteins